MAIFTSCKFVQKSEQSATPDTVISDNKSTTSEDSTPDTCSTSDESLADNTSKRFGFTVYNLVNSREIIEKDSLDILEGIIKFGESVDLEKLIGTQKIHGANDKVYEGYSNLIISKDNNASKTLYAEESFGGFKYIELRGPSGATYKEQIESGQWNLISPSVDFDKIFCVNSNNSSVAIGENKDNSSLNENKAYLSAVLDKFGRPDHLYVFCNGEDAISLFENGMQYSDSKESKSNRTLFIVAVWGTAEGRLYLNMQDGLNIKKDNSGKVYADEYLTFSSVTYAPKAQFADKDATNESAKDYYDR